MLTLILRVLMLALLEREDYPAGIDSIPIFWALAILIVILTSFGKLLRARHIFSIELNTRQVLLAGIYLLTFFLQEATLVSAEIIEKKIRHKSI